MCIDILNTFLTIAIVVREQHSFLLNQTLFTSIHHTQVIFEPPPPLPPKKLKTNFFFPSKVYSFLPIDFVRYPFFFFLIYKFFF